MINYLKAAITFNRTAISVLIAASMAAVPLQAMTLAEAIGYAMEHNRDVLMVKEMIIERKAQITEARADAFPELNLNATTYRVRDPGFLNSTFGQELLKGGSDSGSGEDIGIPLDAILPKPQTFYETSVSFNQTVFTWGKVRSAIQLANLSKKDKELELKNTRQQVAYQVTEAYYNVLMAEEKILVYEKAIEVQKTFLQQTQDNYDFGDATNLDLLRAKSQLASTQPDLLKARNEWELARKNLNFLLGRSLDEDISTVPVDESSVETDAPELDYVVNRALENRPDLERLRVQVNMYEKSIKVFRADFRPSAEVVGQYGFSTINTGDQLDRNFEAWRLAFQVKVPLFDGFRNKGVVGQYKSQQEQKRIELDKSLEQLRLESRQALDSFETAKSVDTASRFALESAREEERVTRDQYDNGLVTSFELLDAHSKAIDAQTAYLEARYGYLLQYAAMKKVMGVPVDRLFDDNDFFNTGGLN